MDKLAETIDAGNPHKVEFHASEIFSRRKPPWKGMDKTEAKGIIKAILEIVKKSWNTANIFSCAVHKASFLGHEPVELAFEDLCSRFDIYLRKLSAEGDRQRGILILDETTHETTLQKMAREFRTLGTTWGVIRSLAETPLFVDSRASRLVQVADSIAYAVFRRYNASDASYFDIIASKFYSQEGVLHGLSHKQTVNPTCMCPACLSRRASHPKEEAG